LPEIRIFDNNSGEKIMAKLIDELKFFEPFAGKTYLRNGVWEDGHEVTYSVDNSKKPVFK
jgi:hypothetical protein